MTIFREVNKNLYSTYRSLDPYDFSSSHGIQHITYVLNKPITISACHSHLYRISFEIYINISCSEFFSWIIAFSLSLLGQHINSIGATVIFLGRGDHWAEGRVDEWAKNVTTNTIPFMRKCMCICIYIYDKHSINDGCSVSVAIHLRKQRKQFGIMKAFKTVVWYWRQWCIDCKLNYLRTLGKLQ